MSASITIELTDEQLAMLRSWGTALNADQVPPEDARSIVGSIVRKAFACLPPEPVRLTIELPPGLAHPDLFDHVTYADLAKTLTLAEAAALTAVAKALKAKQFSDAMADGIDELKAQGVPLA